MPWGKSKVQNTCVLGFKMCEVRKIIVGKPISHSKFNKSKSHFEWAQEVKNHVYKIGKGIESEF